MSKINIPVPVSDPELIAITLAYQNPSLIADRVLPRKPVGREAFRYNVFPKGQFITLQRTKAGRKGELNKVSFEGKKATGAVEHFGLMSPIPAVDSNNVAEGLDPVHIATTGLRDLVLLDREVRAAELVFDAGQYEASNKTQLSGTSQWGDDSSTPVKDIEEAINIPFIRPNKLLLGQAAWSALRQHPDIVSSVNRNSGDKGLASRQAVADLFELDEIIVGKGWVNIAKPGQDPVRDRVWGNHALLFCDSPAAQPSLGMGMTFGFTAQYGTVTAATNEVKPGRMGLDGGVEVVNGEKVIELITAADLAFFFEDAVSG